MSVFHKFIASLDLDPVALGSIIPMMSTEDSVSKPVKHRACDECRTRKLACSKDPDGCERCKKEKITCHYSEQKPMGRPRKRQREEHEHTNSDIHVDLGALPLNLNDIDGYNGADFSEPYFTNAPSTYGLRPEPGDDLAASRLGDGRIVWHFGGDNVMPGPQINFGDIDLGGSNIYPELEGPPELPRSNASLSSDPSTTQSLGPCSCLASLYLSLASLQTLPSDLVSAVKTAREAAATAATCIWCPQCGSVLLDNPDPPIESFQNTMLLGTILPIIANSYQRLLKMVDEEAQAAEAAGQTKSFHFQDYGGLCGQQLTIEQSMACLDKELLFNTVDMPAQQWRTTIRAMLRIDVYGHEMEGIKRKGLKDLVAEMELRQKARHDLLDAHLAAGNKTGPFSGAGCVGTEESRGCFQILNLARVAIDALVIA